MHKKYKEIVTLAAITGLISQRGETLEEVAAANHFAWEQAKKLGVRPDKFYMDVKHMEQVLSVLNEE